METSDIIERLKGKRKVILTHGNSDMDAIGSAYALRNAFGPADIYAPAGVDRVARMVADKLEIPFGIKGYFDYDQALRVAKKEGKPVFLDFTGHGCTNCRNVENAVWIDPEVRRIFAEEVIVCTMYADDKVIPLPDEEKGKLTDANGDPITMLGAKNRYIEQTKYHENSQPCYFVVDPDGNILSGPTYYERDKDNYIAFLRKGIDAYKGK